MPDEDLPPLPPPLPPTHSRSFSSSSSSSAGSTRPAFNRYASGAGTMRRTGSTGGDSPVGTARRGSAAELTRSGSRGLYIKGAPNGSRTSLNSSPSPTLSRTPGLARSLSAASSTSSTRSPTTSSRRGAAASSSQADAASSSSASQRHRASSILAKVSPSLSSSSRYTGTHSTLASVGLWGSPPVSPAPAPPSEPLGLGIGGFAKGLGQLPSPPHTASDGGSNADTSARFNTVGSSTTTATNGSAGSSGDSPSKPHRPPKSEARRGSSATATTPTKGKPAPPIPTIGRTSPTIAGSPAQAARPPRSESPSPLTSPPRRVPLAHDLFAEQEPEQEGDVSGASTTPTRDELAGGTKRRLRARTSSSGAEELLGDDAERRRERRSRNASALKEKNQRILDSINSQNSPSRPSSASALRRSSTSSTIREIAAGQARAASRYGWFEDDEEPRRAARAGTDEFGALDGDGSVRRSQTMGNLAGESSHRDLPLRSQTAGSRSYSRASGAARNRSADLDALPDRSMTSMGSYPTLDERRAARRSDFVGSERTRAASAFGNTAERDRDFAAGMRRLASRELLTSPRERTRSDAAAGAGAAVDDALPDSPANASQSPSLRNRPGLPREFLASPSARLSSRFSHADLASPSSPSAASPSTSSPRFTSTSAARDRLDSPRVSSPRTASPLLTPDPARTRRTYSRSEGVEGLPDELERTPRSGKKSSSGSGGAERDRAADRRTQSISEVIEERPYSRASRANGLRSPAEDSHGTASPPPSASSRYSDIEARLQARKEALRSVDVGTESWQARVQEIRSRARSRQSGSSGDARSLIDNGSAIGAKSLAELEREKTIRTLNDILAGQGIRVSAVDNPTSPTASSTTSSPRKRQSFAGFDTTPHRDRRISFADGTHQDAPSAPGSALLARTSSTGSRAGAESVMRGLIADGAAGDHHKLLLSAFDRFDQHFSSTGNSPESTDLVKRMEVLIASTTKLNSGLRGLVEAIKKKELEAALDEEQRSPTLSVAQFEKAVNALLRSSDDQVRSLTEDLIAFTRVERERDRLRRDGDIGASRPVSRASTYASGGGADGPLHSPPKRAATSSPYEGATVSLASARSPPLARETLRDPLVDPDSPSSGSSRRHTLGFAGRSPFLAGAVDSPSPAGRRESTHVRSPLANDWDSPRSPSVAATARTGLGLPMPPAHTATTPRRARASDGSTVRAGSPGPTGTIRFPTTSAAAQLDDTPAIPNSSPTHFPSRHRDYRTFSEADKRAFEQALMLGANQDESDDAHSPPLPRAADALRASSPEDDLPRPDARNGHGTGEGRRAKPRMSTGALGSAFKNALTFRKSAAEEQPAYSTEAHSPRSSLDAGGSSPEERRAERRRDSESVVNRVLGQRA
ncbi:hypothetical protein JCM10207_004241 [Rhodosporidiobolus poonsookiae]